MKSFTAGTFRFSPGRLEKHEVENLGDIASEFLRVELKKMPLGFQRRDFRSDQAFDLTHSSVATEFDWPFVKMERVIGAGHESAKVAKSENAALVIALSADSVGTTNWQRGEVLWMDAGATAAVSGHRLRIEFLGRGK